MSRYPNYSERSRFCIKYIRAKERALERPKQKKDIADTDKSQEQEGSNGDNGTRAKRIKLNLEIKDKPCIICNSVKRKVKRKGTGFVRRNEQNSC